MPVENRVESSVIRREIKVQSLPGKEWAHSDGNSDVEPGKRCWSLTGTDTRSGGRHFGLCAGPPVADQQNPLTVYPHSQMRQRLHGRKEETEIKERNEQEKAAKKQKKNTSLPLPTLLLPPHQRVCGLGWAPLCQTQTSNWAPSYRGWRLLDPLRFFMGDPSARKDLLFMNFLFSD